jgi:ATP-dependent Lhr-like helicase
MSAENPQLAPSGLEWAHPLVRDWFVSRFGTPTEPQEQGWPHILAGETTLISAPTGSGKTLAAFLICIDSLVRKAVSGELTDNTQVLYVSPLKALSNDIQKNLEIPLGEILQLAGQRGILMRCAPATRWRMSAAPCSHGLRTSWSPRPNRSTSS